MIGTNVSKEVEHLLLRRVGSREEEFACIPASFQSDSEVAASEREPTPDAAGAAQKIFEKCVWSVNAFRMLASGL